MSQSAKAQEPSMEEILASIRRIISDDDTAKASPKLAPAPASPPRPAALPPRTAAPAPAPPPPAPDPAPRMNQNDIDAMLAGNEARSGEPAAPEDILDLTESTMAAPPAASSFQTIDGQPDVVFADAPPAPEAAPRAIDEPRRPFSQTAAPDRSLISSSTSQAVDSAFNTLAQTVLVQNARTLEDLVREMLRPMLKAWLDDNLPGMVERIVRAEIERVSRGRTG